MLISQINPYHTTSEVVYSPHRDAELSVWTFEYCTKTLAGKKGKRLEVIIVLLEQTLSPSVVAMLAMH